MLLKYFYDQKLAHASYLVGCQATGEALVLDPARDITQYLAAAEENGMKIVAAAETHIHADYVSGMRELAARVDAHLYVSDEGDEDWKYLYVKDYNHTLLKEEDTFKIGNIIFKVMHTPGHTPESISFMITDSAGADEPIGIFTGDFVFAGDVGRPDLLEEAAGIMGTKEVGARQMFNSLNAFKQLPDYMQVWPAHGAGSACGKALGAIPSSTIGYEKRFNWALKMENEGAFVPALLEGQPAPPKYFAEMKRVNKEGPAVIGDRFSLLEMDVHDLNELLKSNAWIVDTRSQEAYAAKHIIGTVGIPFDKRSFNTYAGWVLPYDQPVYLIVDEDKLSEAVHDLLYVGLDNIAGYFTTDVLQAWPNEFSSFQLVRPADIVEAVQDQGLEVIDVRSRHEFAAGHLPKAINLPLGRLTDLVDEIPQQGKPVLLTCRSGGRSFVAASLLRARGINDVMNLEGGINAWNESKQPVERSQDVLA